MAGPRLPLVGETVAGKYELVELIGEGGMAVVFRAVHSRLGQSVALKVLHPDVAANAELRHRFEQEARVLARIRAPHVVAVHDVDQLDNGLPYMVLEYLVGQDLEARLAAQNGAPLPAGEAVDCVHQAALGMIDAHRAGVVHRDLKPSNLFLCAPGPEREGRLVKVVDFGISKMLDGGGKVTAAQSTFGTPLYMSPEHVRSAAAADERSDVWSLGAILFECLAGTPLFLRESSSAIFAAITADPVPDLARLRPDLPAALTECVAHALQKEPAARIGTMRELAGRLASLALPDLAAARAPVPSQPGHRADPSGTAVTLARPAEGSLRTRQRKLIIGGSLGAALAVGLAALGVVSLRGSARDASATTRAAAVAAAPPTSPTSPPSPASASAEVDHGPGAADATAPGAAPSTFSPRRALLPAAVASSRPSSVGALRRPMAMPARDPIAP